MTTNKQNKISESFDTQNSDNDFDINHWQRITTFLNNNPQFNLGQIRWLIRNRRNNGFDSCIKKVGRSYYINDQLFALWISNKV